MRKLKNHELDVFSILCVNMLFRLGQYKVAHHSSIVVDEDIYNKMEGIGLMCMQ